MNSVVRYHREAAVNYWVVRGDPTQNNDFDFMMPGRSGRWRTKKPPRGWSSGDRLLFWASAPRLQLFGLGEFRGETGDRTRNGEVLYSVRYLTPVAEQPLGIAELRADPVLTDAIFLKRGPSTSVVRLSVEEGEHLYRLLTTRNPSFKGIWPDIETGDVHWPDVDESAVEGDRRLTQHFRVERSRSLAQKKKRSVLAATGRLACEVCHFEFKDRYGAIAEGFCEVHHKRPLSSLTAPAVTHLDDLAIVCSNCRRVLHLSGCSLSVDELRERIHDV